MIKLSKSAIAICFFISSSGYAYNAEDACLDYFLEQDYRHLEEELDMVYTIAKLTAQYNDDVSVEESLFQRIRKKDPEHLVLEKAQLAWVKMRAASCDHETYESRIGSAFGSIHMGCLIAKTQERIEYLKIHGGTPISATKPLHPFLPRETRKKITAYGHCEYLSKYLGLYTSEQP
ncbi:lysozyme inhibitor LprI family protein [Serratia microhaemolytica]|uniref:lysozyme inhibitor LprI family protein n=1 Tax=Serratia microhaemolytica TaxID=2675110 RepID=UPI000FDF1B66|nr:lysozyme inhibitor LprI family protein [Serratia microhaemolytica]